MLKNLFFSLLITLILSGCSTTRYISSLFVPSEPIKYADTSTKYLKPMRLEDIRYYEVVVINEEGYIQ